MSTDVTSPTAAEADAALSGPSSPHTSSATADGDGESAGARAYRLDRAHVFHSWSAQGALKPLVVERAQGCSVWDGDGREYLDFSSQLVFTNIGHSHPRVVAAITEQAATLATVAPAHATLARSEAAAKIVAHAPDGFSKVFFTNGGADANENAIRLARLHTGREKILSTYRSYHGNTGAAISATGDWRRIPNSYSRGHVHFFGPFRYRSEFWSTSVEQECERALHHLDRVIRCEGPGTIAAILLESIPGTAGVLMPPPGYLAGVRALADEHGILLITDEVMSGFGRAGSWFAFERELPAGTAPDLITFAKGVNSGYVPAGGVVISDEIAHGFDDTVFPGGLTYSGHPLAMAAIVATITAMEDEGIVEHAAAIGRDVLGPALHDLATRHPSIGEVRGTGVFWALDLVTDRSTRAPLPAAALAATAAEARSRGVLPFTADNRLHVVPPCTITAEEVARGVAVLDAALAVADAAGTGR